MAFNVFTNNNLSLSITAGYQNYTNLISKYVQNGTTIVTESPTILSPYSPPSSWTCMASNSDGSIQVACTQTEIYIYRNQTWTSIYLDTGTSLFNSVCMSEDGRYISATNIDGLYVLNGSGTTYTYSNYSQSNMKQVCMSSSGQFQLAVSGGTDSYIYTSSNYGVQWTIILYPRITFTCCCMSLGGTFQYVFSLVGSIYRSVNQGTFSFLKTLNLTQIFSCSMSSKPPFIYILAVSTTKIYVSSSVNWEDTYTTITPLSGTSPPYSSSVTYDGSSMWVINGNVYNSTNYGQTWNNISIPFSCSYVFATQNVSFIQNTSPGQIYTYISGKNGETPTIQQKQCLDISKNIISFDKNH